MRRFFLLLGVLCLTGRADALRIIRLDTPERWKRLEFRIDGVASVSNPFDPDQITVDAQFTLPSGRVMKVPGFWYRAYTRTLNGGSESLAGGNTEWRVRFAPTEIGSYALHVSSTRNGLPDGTPADTTFTVADRAATGPQGYAKLSPDGRYFQTERGDSLPLIGANVCWHGGAGTYDYDKWFGKMATAGENWARLWMCPWAFGIETQTGERNNYRLDHAWQLDYVLDLADRKGIYIMLCLDYHGMFEVTPDYWGGNNFWPSNPYNSANGGPCANQNAFFTTVQAKAIYKKRLRYLVGRYGYSTHLLCWEFFNEIDNVYAYLNAGDVANWHGEIGRYLHTNDPFRHLVTTSLTGSSDRSEIWNLPEMDFAQYHAYGLPNPTTAFRDVASSFVTRYRKPVLFGEFGVDWRGWSKDYGDPYLRGLRQGLWSGALNGSAGTAMSWWWENLDSENVYPVYAALGSLLEKTSWGTGVWKPIAFPSAGLPPDTLGAQTPGPAFTVTVPLDGGWGTQVRGTMALPDAAAAGWGSTLLNSFVQGTGHPDLRRPFKVTVWLGSNAKLTMHLNSVSDGAIMQVKVDGVETFRRSVPNLDGLWLVNNEYNQDVTTSLPAGKHTVEIANAGNDWFFLDRITLENVLPSEYPNQWQQNVTAIGIAGARESLLYVVNPAADYPVGATAPTIAPLTNGSITLLNQPAGIWQASWYDPLTTAFVTQSFGITASDGSLVLFLPTFAEDLVARVVRLTTVTGTVTLPDAVEKAQTLLFTFRPADGSAPFTRPVTLDAAGHFTLDYIPAGTYVLAVKGTKWLRKTLPNVDTLAAVPQNLTLLPGDANDDNTVNFDDFQILADAYFTTRGQDAFYDDRADFTCDGEVNFDDFLLLASSYFEVGDE